MLIFQGVYTSVSGMVYSLKRHPCFFLMRICNIELPFFEKHQFPKKLPHINAQWKIHQDHQDHQASGPGLFQRLGAKTRATRVFWSHNWTETSPPKKELEDLRVSRQQCTMSTHSLVVLPILPPPQPQPLPLPPLLTCNQNMIENLYLFWSTVQLFYRSVYIVDI